MALERIDKLLSHMGYGSRRQAALWAKQGLITAGGRRVKKADEKIDPEREALFLDGKQVEYEKYTYLMLHKAAGYLSATEDLRQKTVLDLLPERYQRMGLFPAGRLDKDTEGLLILTNDGVFCHAMMSPAHHVDKVYFARVEGTAAADAAQRFQSGFMTLDGEKLLPAKLEFLEDGLVKVTVQEGKFHQVKRMLKAVGLETVYLKRLSIGPVRLDSSLPVGGFRSLTPQELAQLKKASGLAAE